VIDLVKTNVNGKRSKIDRFILDRSNVNTVLDKSIMSKATYKKVYMFK